jgi:hypothetical protein
MREGHGRAPAKSWWCPMRNRRAPRSLRCSRPDNVAARFVVSMSIANNDIQRALDDVIRADKNDDPDYTYRLRLTIRPPSRGVAARLNEPESEPRRFRLRRSRPRARPSARPAARAS